MKAKKTILVILITTLACATLAGWYANRSRGINAYLFNTAQVSKGTLVVTISATGTVEPEEVIDVGAQVAGRIIAFGRDRHGKPIDYGSEVTAGMILAQIDDAIYKVEASQVEAQEGQAEAQVASALSNLEQYRARFNQAERDWDRAKKIGPSEALAQSAYDAYRSAFEIAKANLGVGEAAVRQAQAAVAQVKAAEARTQLNLGYCVIKSPVDGIIIDRRVNIGQTVVASLNAPSLFLLAKDLKKMQVWIAVNEADIGNIKPGQAVTFTADAFPGETFRGTVGKVRLNATMTQNVVTYTVEVMTDNSSGKLLPYLTANAQFQIDRRENVLTVPNAALRWIPQPQMLSPAAGVKGPENRRPGAGNRTSAPGNLQSDPTSAGEGIGTVWVKDGNHVKPVRVKTGISDGTLTEVAGEQLSEGMEVIVAEAVPLAGSTGRAGSPPAAQAASGTTNPFAPQFPNRRR